MSSWFVRMIQNMIYRKRSMQCCYLNVVLYHLSDVWEFHIGSWSSHRNIMRDEEPSWAQPSPQQHTPSTATQMLHHNAFSAHRNKMTREPIRRVLNCNISSLAWGRIETHEKKENKCSGDIITFCMVHIEMSWLQLLKSHLFRLCLWQTWLAVGTRYLSATGTSEAGLFLMSSSRKGQIHPRFPLWLFIYLLICLFFVCLFDCVIVWLLVVPRRCWSCPSLIWSSL